MPKEEWGLKHLCETCGTKYYDLRRDPILCPSCRTRVVLSATDGDGAPDLDVKGSKVEKRDKLPGTVSGAADILERTEESDVDINDNVLEEDDEDTVPLDDIANVATDDES